MISCHDNESVSSIKYTDSITVDTYIAPYDDEKSVVLIDYSPMTIDMSEYIAALGDWTRARPIQSR